MSKIGSLIKLLPLDVSIRRRDRRTCSRCGKSKALTEYYYIMAKGRHRARCRTCISEINRAYTLANRERNRARCKARYWKDPERARAEKRAEYWRNPAMSRARERMKSNKRREELQKND